MKKNVCFLLTLILAIQFFLPVPFAEAYVSLTAPSAILLDPVSQKIIYARAPHRRQPLASTTKIVTALVVLDSLPLDRWVTVSSRVEGVERSKLYLKGGDRFRVIDLLKALLINSANDAAAALAIGVSGSEREFAALMTQKARNLGTRNTHFVNASGLPAEGQYSTVYDLALIMREAMKNDVIVSILKQKRTTIQTANGKVFHLKSHNKMLWRREGVIGKTGWTRRAKFCFVGLVRDSGHETIVSVLGSKKLWIDLNRLANRVTGGISKSGSQKVISFGSRGTEVKRLQFGLKHAGFFTGSTTGYFGKKTRQALLQFQKARGLPPDGTLGIETKKALQPYL